MIDRILSAIFVSIVPVNLAFYALLALSDWPLPGSLAPTVFFAFAANVMFYFVIRQKVC